MRYIVFLVSFLWAAVSIGQIPVNTNFSPAIAAPIDVRAKINSLSDTTSIAFKYDGMITYVVAEGKTYVRKPGIWEEIGTGVGGVAGVASINGETGIVSLKTVNSVPISGAGNIEVDTMIGLYNFVAGRLSNLLTKHPDSVVQVYWGGTSITTIARDWGFLKWVRDVYGDAGNRETRFGELGGSFDRPWPSGGTTALSTDWLKQIYGGRGFRRLVGTPTSTTITDRGVAKKVVLTYSTEVGGGTFQATVNGITRTISCNGAQSVNNEEVWVFDSIVPVTVTINNVQGGDVYLEYLRFMQNKPGVDIVFGALGGSALTQKTGVLNGSTPYMRTPISVQNYVAIDGEFGKKTQNYNLKIIVFCWTANDANLGLNGIINNYNPLLDRVVFHAGNNGSQILFIPEIVGHYNVAAINIDRYNGAKEIRRQMYKHAKYKDFVSVLDWGGVIQEGYDFTKNIDVLKFIDKHYTGKVVYDTTTHTFTGDFIHPDGDAYDVLDEMLKKTFQLNPNTSREYNKSSIIEYVKNEKGLQIGQVRSLLFPNELIDTLYYTDDCNLSPEINRLINSNVSKKIVVTNQYYYLSNYYVKPSDTLTVVVAAENDLTFSIRDGQNSQVFLPLLEKGSFYTPNYTITTPPNLDGFNYYYATYVVPADKTTSQLFVTGTLKGLWLTKGKIKKIANGSICWDVNQLPYSSSFLDPIIGVAYNTTDTIKKIVYQSYTLDPTLNPKPLVVFGTFRKYAKSTFADGVVPTSSPVLLRLLGNNGLLRANEKYSLFFKAAQVDTTTGDAEAGLNYRISIYNASNNAEYFYNEETKTWSNVVSSYYQKSNIKGFTYTTFTLPPEHVNNMELRVRFDGVPIHKMLLSTVYVCPGDSLQLPNNLQISNPNIDVDRFDETRRIWYGKKQNSSTTTADPIFQCVLNSQNGNYTEQNQTIYITLNSDAGYRSGEMRCLFARATFEDIAENIMYELLPTDIMGYPSTGANSPAYSKIGLYVLRTGTTFKFFLQTDGANMFYSVFTNNYVNPITITANTDPVYTLTDAEPVLFSKMADFKKFEVFVKDGTEGTVTPGILFDYSTTANGFIYKDGTTVREIVDVPTGTLTNDHVVVVSGTTFTTRADREGVTSVTAAAGAGISITGNTTVTSTGTFTVTNTGDTNASDDITGDAVSVNHDFSSIAVGGIQSATITVAGANSNKVLVVNADLPDGVLLQIKSTSPDSARLTIFNFTGAIYDPPSTLFLIRVLN